MGHDHPLDAHSASARRFTGLVLPPLFGQRLAAAAAETPPLHVYREQKKEEEEAEGGFVASPACLAKAPCERHGGTVAPPIPAAALFPIHQRGALISVSKLIFMRGKEKEDSLLSEAEASHTLWYTLLRGLSSRRTMILIYFACFAFL